MSKLNFKGKTVLTSPPNVTDPIPYYPESKIQLEKQDGRINITSSTYLRIKGRDDLYRDIKIVGCRLYVEEKYDLYSLEIISEVKELFIRKVYMTSLLYDVSDDEPSEYQIDEKERIQILNTI